jgi:hypothetical protein
VEQPGGEGRGSGGRAERVRGGLHDQRTVRERIEREGQGGGKDVFKLGICVVGWSGAKGDERRAQIYNRTRAKMCALMDALVLCATCAPCDNRPARMRNAEREHVKMSGAWVFHHRLAQAVSTEGLEAPFCPILREERKQEIKGNE